MRTKTVTKTMAEVNQYKKGFWTEEEDKILMDYIQVHGKGQWNKIAKKTGLKRCGKSCRLRWINYLNPNVKRGHFSEEEEDLIIRLHNLLGNRWSLISKLLPGRTDNQVKNYWNTHLSRKLAAQDQNGILGRKEQSGRSVVVSSSTNLSAVESTTATKSGSSPPEETAAATEITNFDGTQKGIELSDSQEQIIEDIYVSSFWISDDDALQLSSLSIDFLDGYSFDLT